MNRPPAPNLYKRHRFPVEIINHCVWLYFRFYLSYRGVEELMAERGVSLTYEGALLVPEVRASLRQCGAPAAPQTR